MIEYVNTKYKLFRAHGIPTSQHTYQYYLTGKRLNVGFVLEVPILTKDSRKFVWNNWHTFVNGEFCSAHDDNTYKDLNSILPCPLTKALF